MIDPGSAFMTALMAAAAGLIAMPDHLYEDGGFGLSDLARGRWEMLFAALWTITVAILIIAVFQHLDIRVRQA